MKVGTITFHWATNYGAVLQAYALQKFLLNNGIDTEIIDYVPRRIKLLEHFSWIKNLRISNFRKEKLLNKFRNTEMVLSEKNYSDNNSLFRLQDKYDCVIVGSDQVWNRGFTLKAEGKPTLSYFLNFAGNHCKRVSYAASFGFDKADEDYVSIVKNEIRKFDDISVRENTGLDVLHQLNVEGRTICDPTLLLEKECYNSFADKSDCQCEKVFSFILHKNQQIAENVSKTVKIMLGAQEKKAVRNTLTVYDWLKNIRDSEIVVTNSFHAVMFSLIFNTRFIVVPVSESKMNDRITTILDKVGLSDCFIFDDEPEIVSYVLGREINWDVVNKELSSLRNDGQKFILNAIKKD